MYRHIHKQFFVHIHTYIYIEILVKDPITRGGGEFVVELAIRSVQRGECGGGREGGGGCEGGGGEGGGGGGGG